MTGAQNETGASPLKRVAIKLGYTLTSLAKALDDAVEQDLPPTTIQYWWYDKRNKHAVIPHDKPWREPLRKVLLQKGMAPNQEIELFGALSTQSTARKHHITAPHEDPSGTLKQERVKRASTLGRGEQGGMDSLAMRIIRLENTVDQLREELAELRLMAAKRRKPRHRP
jgi:hypothetical protein